MRIPRLLLVTLVVALALSIFGISFLLITKAAFESVSIDWTTVITSAVVAAVISGFTSVVNFLILRYFSRMVVKFEETLSNNKNKGLKDE